MLPFLASSVKIVKSDGTTTTVNSESDEAREEAGEDTSTKSITSVPSKSGRHSSSGDSSTVVPIVAIVFVFLWLIIKTLMAPFTQRQGLKLNKNSPPPAAQGGFTDEEVALLHKLTQTLAQMERRVESLETILIDQTRTKENYGTKL